MKKKILSIILSIITIVVCIAPASSAVSAATYREQLKSKGFPDSYLDSLVSLHTKYPNCDFEPFVTGLKWSDAVAGERSSHSKQLIQKQSSLSSAYYCNCSKCMKNGSYVAQ
ncbi:MAG: hypothetical protein ACI4IE_08950, partial [Eubacterium sp.]